MKYAADIHINNMTENQKNIYTNLKENCTHLMQSLNDGSFDILQIKDMCSSIDEIIMNNKVLR